MVIIGTVCLIECYHNEQHFTARSSNTPSVPSTVSSHCMLFSISLPSLLTPLKLRQESTDLLRMWGKALQCPITSGFGYSVSLFTILFLVSSLEAQSLRRSWIHGTNLRTPLLTALKMHGDRWWSPSVLLGQLSSCGFPSKLTKSHFRRTREIVQLTAVGFWLSSRGWQVDMACGFDVDDATTPPS